MSERAHPANTTPYDRDFHAWTTEQAGLLGSGRLSKLDIVPA